ncbi:hypothetical protein Dsin_024910 [Dipteronia sinensis]|uniref:Uncharacterized protein n=1 Tax=Dipteronia sinensis TaxID=43782 RepID=A0AAD9ZUW2_9ROSI|nr:hypothetical protein Dsin_024910 [Dipteronia sinensis]
MDKEFHLYPDAFDLEGLSCLNEKAAGLRLVRVKIAKEGSTDMDWADTFQYRQATRPIIYLGLPLGATPSSKAFWDPIVKCTENKMALWKRNFLNKGGRLVLIKAVLSSIPAYYLSILNFLPGWPMSLKSFKEASFGVMGLRRKKLMLSTGKRFARAKDILAWMYAPDGKFTVGSFQKCLEDVLTKNSTEYNFIWQGVNPPKVEIFLRGDPGNAVIDGVLRNKSGQILGLFSLFVGTGNSRFAKIVAIQKAPSLCSQSTSLIGNDIDIVIDSSEAVS